MLPDVQAHATIVDRLSSMTLVTLAGLRIAILQNSQLTDSAD